MRYLLTETTADCAFALLMAAARRLPEAYDYVRADRWKTWGPLLLLGPDVHHATLGVVEANVRLAPLPPAPQGPREVADGGIEAVHPAARLHRAPSISTRSMRRS